MMCDSRSGPRLCGGQLGHWLGRRVAGQLEVLLRAVRGLLAITPYWRRWASCRGDFDRKVCCIDAKSDPFLLCAAGGQAAVACIVKQPFPWSGPIPEPRSYTEEEESAILEAMERAAERARTFVPPFVIIGNEYRTVSPRHVANFWERNCGQRLGVTSDHSAVRKAA
jgi:hypothetical protein